MGVVVDIAANTLVISVDDTGLVSVLTKNREDVMVRVSPSNSDVVELIKTSPQESNKQVYFSSLYSNFTTPSGASAAAVVSGITTILQT